MDPESKINRFHRNPDKWNTHKWVTQILPLLSHGLQIGNFPTQDVNDFIINTETVFKYKSVHLKEL